MPFEFFFSRRLIDYSDSEESSSDLNNSIDQITTKRSSKDESSKFGCPENPVSSPLSRQIHAAFQELELNSSDSDSDDEIIETPRFLTKKTAGSFKKLNLDENAISPEHSRSSVRELEENLLRSRLTRETSYGENYGQIKSGKNTSTSLSLPSECQEDNVSVSTGLTITSNSHKSPVDATPLAGPATEESEISKFLYQEYQEAYKIENFINSKYEEKISQTNSPMRSTCRQNSGNVGGKSSSNTLENKTPTPSSNKNFIFSPEADKISRTRNNSHLDRIRFYETEFDRLKNEVNAAPDLTSSPILNKLKHLEQSQKNLGNVTNATANTSSHKLLQALANLKIQEEKTSQKLQNRMEEEKNIDEFNGFLKEVGDKLTGLEMELEESVVNWGWVGRI